MGQRRIRLIIGAVGLVWGLSSEVLYYRAGMPAYEVLLDLAIGWTYLYGGLALWSSRPANLTGRLMTLVGLTWFIGNVGISDVPGLSQVAGIFGDVSAVCLIALILAYPGGTLETRLDRATVGVLAVGTFAGNAIQLLPASPGIDLALARLYVSVGLASFAGAVVIRRWLVAPRRRRPELLPVLFAGTILMAVLVINLAVQTAAVPESLSAFLQAAKSLGPAAIPLALLVGFYRQSEHRQRALLDAMPDLMIRFTRDGHRLDVRAEDSPLFRESSSPELQGRIEDVVPADVARAMLSAAAVAIETGELQTVDFAIDLPAGSRAFEMRITPSGADEVTAVVRDFTDQRAAQSELRQSRSRIIEATDAERRRLERDLHDGAQQRLVSASLAVRQARTRVGAEAATGAVTALDEAAAELKTAIVELRELARGIHPAILTEAGLGPAIDTLAERSSVDISVIARPDRRLPPAVEATAYFIVSEALANVHKYASATHVTIAAHCPDGSLQVEVADDGVGGADPAAGSGLRGLADRVAALGGSLSIVSPMGGGTSVSAEIPLG